MGTVNASNPKVDQTVKIFDQFYAFESSVPAAEFDIVFSYFKSIFTDQNAALNFTTALFRVAFLSDTPVLDLLKTIQKNGTDTMSLNATLCYFFNALRSPSTLLGINTIQPANFYTARNVYA
jgi:hypothetical protein